MTAQNQIKRLFTADIACEVYEPMVGKVSYGPEEIGIPQKTHSEEEAEFGWKYTVVSPLSPYALGGMLWQMLCANAEGKSLSEVFEADVDFEAKTITVSLKGDI